MSHRILHVAQVGPSLFPRYVISDASGNTWDGAYWCGRPLLYADWHLIASDCCDLQRAEAANKKHRLAVEIPIRFEVFSDVPLDLDQLRDWLVRNVSVNVDVTTGSGPTHDSIVIGSIEWPHFTIVGETT